MVATFEFTDRATPIVQFGRSANREQGDARWGTAVWGASQWGARDWEPEWTDLTCEIHEITTDTGRAGAVDRFRPGTATVVASNVHGVSKMIWPLMPPPPTPFEFVPQPPITHEEDLQAPNAATVVSNGWSFTDDFETAGPHWRFPPAYSSVAKPMLWGDGFVMPETYGLDPGTPDVYEAHGVAQWTGPVPHPLYAQCQMMIEDLHWPVGTTGSGANAPRCVVEIYAYGNTTDRACNCARFTLTPNFSGNNTATIDLLKLDSTGATIDSVPTSTETVGLGTNGDFGSVEFLSVFGPDPDPSHGGSAYGAVNDQYSSGWSPAYDFFATGSRIGFAVHFYEGNPPGSTESLGGPHVTSFIGPGFEDEFSRPTGSGWVVNPEMEGYGPMLMEGGAMTGPVVYDGFWYNGSYTAMGAAQWVSEFDGDQFIELELTGLSWPDTLYGGTDQSIELYCKGNRNDLRCIAASIVYWVDWGDGSCGIDWVIVQYGPRGEWVYDPDVEGESFGTINYGVINGVFPEPARWRLEADTSGDARLFYGGDLLGATSFPDIPDGGRIGLWYQWRAGGPEAPGFRPQPSRIEQVWGGLQEPLGTEELGSWIRIGVDHAELGEQWFFRGFVDGIVPTYIPNHADAVRIECIDSLGEAGRAGVIDTWLPHKFAAAPTRIRQLLNAAHWPANLRQIHDDSTLMSRPANGKAVDGLTRVAESCGGAVYGDPVSGDIVFKGTDWQGVAASLPPLAVITNVDTEGDELLPRVCPVGWELSKRRGDLLTRVRLSSETSDTVDGHPIVKEWRSPEMEHIYGVELYEATVLAITAERINELAIRQLRVRGARDTPRVEAVLLDAATADEALDLMTTATFTVPSKYRCSHHADDDLWAFNTNYLVTGVRHRIRPTQWTCRLALDLSAPFHETGGRWGRARWGVDVWGKTR